MPPPVKQVPGYSKFEFLGSQGSRVFCSRFPVRVLEFVFAGLFLNLYEVRALVLKTQYTIGAQLHALQLYTVQTCVYSTASRAAAASIVYYLSLFLPPLPAQPRRHMSPCARQHCCCAGVSLLLTVSRDFFHVSQPRAGTITYWGKKKEKKEKKTSR